MPLLDAPLPRMAGRLSFMRAACKPLDAVRPGDLAVVGLPVEDIDAAHSGQSLAPRALRETSVYFGWHANPQFSHPVDVDDRREISTAGMFERMCDLGDVRAPCMAQAVSALSRELRARRATAVFLGGDAALTQSAQAAARIQLGGEGHDGELTLAPVAGPGVPADGARGDDAVAALIARHLDGARDACLVFDLSVFATSLSGLCDRPRLGGCALPEVSRWMAALGAAPVSTVFLTGLNPTLSGMGVIKTGQRLMVTALLSFIYAKLGATGRQPAPAPALEVETR